MFFVRTSISVVFSACLHQNYTAEKTIRPPKNFSIYAWPLGIKTIIPLGEHQASTIYE